jgi:hypothetical protein
MTFKTATYHGPPLADDSGELIPEPIPQPGRIYPVSEAAMENFRKHLASQPPRPERRRRNKTDVVGNLLRRQREKEREREAGKKKGGVEVETHELAQRILAKARNADKESAMNVNGNGNAPIDRKKLGAKRVGIPPRELVEQIHLEYYQTGWTLGEIGGANDFAEVSATTVKKWFERYGLPVARRVGDRYWRPATNDTPETAAPAETIIPAGEMPTYDEFLAEEAAAPESAADELLGELLDLESDESEPPMETMPDFWRSPANGVGAQTSTPANATLLELARLLQSAGVTGTIRLQLSADLEVRL